MGLHDCEALESAGIKSMQAAVSSRRRSMISTSVNNGEHETSFYSGARRKTTANTDKIPLKRLFPISPT